MCITGSFRPIFRLPRQMLKRDVQRGNCVIARIAGDFGTEPWWRLEELLLVFDLDLGDDQPGIATLEDVDLPGKTTPWHFVTRFRERALMAL